jgi:hypothetical protein
MTITRTNIADMLRKYLRHELPLAALVDWAEAAMIEGDFEDAHYPAVRDAIARIGLADVRSFGLAWEDCEQILASLGFAARVEIVAA